MTPEEGVTITAPEIPAPCGRFAFGLDGTGECPERQRGRTVNPLAYAFVGSSPTSPTILVSSVRGCSSMVEQQPSKLMTRVRFPSPAPKFHLCGEAFRVLAEPSTGRSAAYRAAGARKA